MGGNAVRYMDKLEVQGNYPNSFLEFEKLLFINMHHYMIGIFTGTNYMSCGNVAPYKNLLMCLTMQ